MRYFLSALCFVLFAVFGSFVFAQEFAVPTPVFNFPVSVQKGNPLRISLRFSQVPFPAGKYPGVAFLICRHGESLLDCYNGARRGERVMRGAEGSQVEGRDSFSFDINTNSLAPGEYFMKFGVAWWADASKVGGLVGNDVFDSTSFGVEVPAEIEVLSPPRGVVLQPGNQYTFTWKWRQGTYPFGQRGWNYLLGQRSSVVKADGSADATLNTWFNTLLAERFSQLGDGLGRDGDSFTFTIPESRDGARYLSGGRKFQILIQTVTPTGEPSEQKPAELSLDVTPVKGDVSGNGSVGYEDLVAVAQFIRDVPDPGVQAQDQHKTSLVLYDVRQDGRVDKMDLQEIVSRYPEP